MTMHELDLPDTYLGSNSFNISDLTPFFVGLPNVWTNFLPPEVHDEDLGGSALMDQTQPLRRKTRRWPQDIGPNQDSPTTTSAPSLPQRITRTRA